jgi:hypothetical protein
VRFSATVEKVNDDDLSVLPQSGFDHLQLLERLGITDEVLLGNFVNQANSFSLALAT